MVDEVDVTAAWEGLTSGPRSQLVDVRTRAEWTYVGIPDLAPIGKRAVLTAGHCVYSDGGWARNVQFIPRYADGQKPLGTFAEFLAQLLLFFGGEVPESFLKLFSERAPLLRRQVAKALKALFQGLTSLRWKLAPLLPALRLRRSGVENLIGPALD